MDKRATVLLSAASPHACMYDALSACEQYVYDCLGIADKHGSFLKSVAAQPNAGLGPWSLLSILRAYLDLGLASSKQERRE